MPEYNPLSQSMALEDEPIRVLDIDEEEPPEFDLEALLAKAEDDGEESLTDEEYAWLVMELQQDNMRDEPGHFDNLAEYLDENELRKIGKKVVEWVSWDEQSRAEWYEREKNGIRLLGVSPNVDVGADFEGASKVVHPMLGEACIQFNARAIAELWPAGGPVKTAVLGKKTPELLQQASRVEQYMNYQYTEEMPGAFDETDRMLMRLPLSGSVFKKAYNDPIDGIVCRMVEPADFIMPYRGSACLRSTPRYTEVVKMSPNNVRKRQVAGIYRDIDLLQPNEDTHEEERVIITDEIKETEGRENVGYNTEDDNHTLYECVCEYDLPGFEDLDESGRPTGIALQYLITVDRDTQNVLSIYRNWKEEDPKKDRLVYHTHYRFMPGLGSYGYGLYHWIGSISRAASGSINALLDSAGFSNLRGGFRSSDAKIPNGDMAIGPGEWKEVDCPAEDLAKAFFSLPYNEPSVVLFNLLGHLEDLGRRVGATVDAMVGDGAQNTPVGTMLARIEQGSKVYTGVQKRLHVAFKEEFKIVAWLNSQYLPEEYPYAVEGEDRNVLRSDFDERVDVIPVSDPNLVSNIQRYFISQAAIEIASQAPQLYDMRALHRRVLQSLRMENIEEVLPVDKPPPHIDPVRENAMVMQGHPVKAYPDQNHQAHNIMHMSVLELLKDNDQARMAMIAHMQEHDAQAYMIQMAQATGVPFLDLEAQQQQDQEQPLPPDVENQIAMLAAQAAQKFMESSMRPDPEAIKLEREQARKDAAAKADIDRKAALAQADIERKDATTLHDMARRNQEQINDLYERNGVNTGA